jgi:replicative DNA helicase
MLQDALNVSFDVTVGHNYLQDAAERFDAYTKKDECIPFDLQRLNDVTKGGMKRKSLSSVCAQSGGGKSIFMTHTAASTLKQGKNVLYITLEMSEERIAERIDANLMNIAVDSIKNLGKDNFVTKVENIAAKTHGKLYIKEYPTGSAHSGHFRGLLEELKTKQNFKPDLVIVDYLGICASSRMRMGGSVNTYSYIKSIAEELRGLAVEYDVAMLTGVQLNRGGFENSDVDLANTADSMGIAMTMDLMFALIATEELNDLNQTIVKVLKNRYGELTKFIVGLDKPKMMFYDVEDSAQTLAPVNTTRNFKKSPEKDVPAFDKTRTGRAISGEKVSGFKF